MSAFFSQKKKKYLVGACILALTLPGFAGPVTNADWGDSRLLASLYANKQWHADNQNNVRNRVFRAGSVPRLADLPRGRARDRLEQLQTRARERALAWLGEFTFHERDLSYMDFDRDGGVLYVDDFDVDPIDSPSKADADTGIQATAANVFALHSKPGARNVLFLDFDGHTISGTAWNSGGASSYRAAPFSLDGDDYSFSDTERAKIQEMWHRVAEDFAPFDIDVTTEEPSSFNSTTGHVLITRDRDLNDTAMPHDTAGGVAYVGVWGRSNYSYYSPALVYYDNLGKSANYIAEAASHEAGHNLNLSHDGDASNAYYTGHGSGDVSWAPIMGVGYYKNVTQWSKGEYSGATQKQNDINVIAGKLGYRDDDHGDDANNATPLVLTDGNRIDSTNPEIDPDNTVPHNKGIIEQQGDVDTFSFATGAGTVEINALPAWDAFQLDGRRGANLDIQMTLYSDSKVIAVSDGQDVTEASIQTTLAAGTYFVDITGTGSDSSPYSDYGSLGQYFIVGTVADDGGDTTPPNPDPMAWSQAPQAAGRDMIEMKSVSATDASGGVEYRFTCTAGGPGCNTSPWQAETFYVAEGLNPDTSYAFHVTARDALGNVTQPSPVVNATTLANAAPSAKDDTATGGRNTNITVAVLANDSDPERDHISVSHAASPANGSVNTNGTTITYTPNRDWSGTDEFAYEITDSFGASASAVVKVTVDAGNASPLARDDRATGEINTPLVVKVLANDEDPDGDRLQVAGVATPAHGSTSTDGVNVTYTPAPDWSGSDSFSYTVADPAGLTSTATVFVDIAAGNQPPVAVNDTAQTHADNPVKVSVLGNDSDPDGDVLSIIEISAGTNGVTSTDGKTASYTPNRGWSGTDTFSYTIADPDGLTSTARVTVEVTAGDRDNTAPVAKRDYVRVNTGESALINVLANDYDADGDTLSLVSVSSANRGQVSINGDRISYAAGSLRGRDTLHYTITDGQATATGKLVIRISRARR